MTDKLAEVEQTLADSLKKAGVSDTGIQIIGDKVLPIISRLLDEAIQENNDRWLCALLDIESGGTWNTAKMEESADLYRKQIRDAARSDQQEPGPCGLHPKACLIRGHFFEAMKPCDEPYDAYKCDICRKDMHSHRDTYPTSWYQNEYCTACEHERHAVEAAHADALRAAADLHDDENWDWHAKDYRKAILALIPERARLENELEVAKAKLFGMYRFAEADKQLGVVADLEAKLAALEEKELPSK